MRLLALFYLITLPVTAGPFPGPPGTPGSTAIPAADPRFTHWINGHVSLTYGSDVVEAWQVPANAHGPPGTDSFDIVCLGNGGSITVHFPHPVRDGAGPDFAVFENGFFAGTGIFAELAFVEVSSDGLTFTRFPTTSLNPSPVGALAGVDITNIDGFAGKYPLGFGTPFDLADLPASPSLDRENVRFVRLIDIVGSGLAVDSAGRPIYDPTPTIGSGGFDLAAIGVIHANDGPIDRVAFSVDPHGPRLSWASNPGSEYRIETSTTLQVWEPVAQFSGVKTGPNTSWSTAMPTVDRCFWRVIRLDP